MLVILYFGEKDHVVVSEFFGARRAVGIVHIIVLCLLPGFGQILIHFFDELRNGVITAIKRPAYKGAGERGILLTRDIFLNGNQDI